METSQKNIERKYKQLARASRGIRFEVIETMGPSVSGVKRSLMIPPYAMRSSSMIKAYTYRTLPNAPKPSYNSKR